MSDAIKMPDNFKTAIVDFSRDLSTTFPEYNVFLSKWFNETTAMSDYETLFRYCVSKFPERFFDILYQNDDIFKTDSELNTVFLPGLDFKLLFNSEGVSDATKKSIWKYLQLILFTIVGTMKDSANFGDAMNMFAGIGEKDLHAKLNETMEGMQDFFSKMGMGQGDSGAKKSSPTEDPADSGEDEPTASASDFNFNFDKMGGMPNINEIHENLKGMFDGKIGSLAKELAEEISGDISGIFGEEFEGASTTEDILKQIMKNPQKMMSLVKMVGNKLNNKMKSGDISQDELMKEAGDLMEKMKNMGGADKFGEILKNMAKGLGKGARVDTNAMNNKMKQTQLRERLKQRMQQKKVQKDMEDLARSQLQAQTVTKNIGGKTQEDLEKELIAMFDEPAPPIVEASKKKKKNKK